MLGQDKAGQDRWGLVRTFRMTFYNEGQAGVDFRLQEILPRRPPGRGGAENHADSKIRFSENGKTSTMTRERRITDTVIIVPHSIPDPRTRDKQR